MFSKATLLYCHRSMFSYREFYILLFLKKFTIVKFEKMIVVGITIIRKKKSFFVFFMKNIYTSQKYPEYVNFEVINILLNNVNS
jgi:hypothetical protein